MENRVAFGVHGCNAVSVLATTATMSSSPSLNVDARDLRLRGNSPMSKKGQRLGHVVSGFSFLGFGFLAKSDQKYDSDRSPTNP